MKETDGEAFPGGSEVVISMIGSEGLDVRGFSSGSYTEAEGLEGDIGMEGFCGGIQK